MGIIQKLNGKKPVASPGSASPPTGREAGHDGRDRLHFLASEVVKANDAVADLDARLDRLVGIIRDADAAHAALQEAVAADGGVSLAAFAAGSASDQPIAKLITEEENTAKAAAAAKGALPNAQAMLNAARAEVGKLEQEKENAALTYLRTRADEVALSYKRVFHLLCSTHDQLVGISAALSATGEFGGEIVMSTLPITVPRFNLPSTADPNEYLATMKHLASEIAVADSASNWTQARNRLTKDVDAALDDLIGPQSQYASDRDL